MIESALRPASRQSSASLRNLCSARGAGAARDRGRLFRRLAVRAVLGCGRARRAVGMDRAGGAGNRMRLRWRCAVRLRAAATWHRPGRLLIGSARWRSLYRAPQRRFWIAAASLCLLAMRRCCCATMDLRCNLVLCSRSSGRPTSLGYFAGRAIGGPKLWPAISPKKTWSGAIAGLPARCSWSRSRARVYSGTLDHRRLWRSPAAVDRRRRPATCSNPRSSATSAPRMQASSFPAMAA